jgi:hypothetical protein
MHPDLPAPAQVYDPLLRLINHHRQPGITMKIIPVKILGYKHSQRYPILRILTRIQKDFEKEHAQFQLDIQEVSSVDEILSFTPVIAFPSLMIGEKLVCAGRSPEKKEILTWLENEIH